MKNAVFAHLNENVVIKFSNLLKSLPNVVFQQNSVLDNISS